MAQLLRTVALLIAVAVLAPVAGVTMSTPAAAQDELARLNIWIFVVGEDPGTLSEVDVRQTSDGTLMGTVFTTGLDDVVVDAGTSSIYFDLPQGWAVDGIHCGDGATGTTGGVAPGARPTHISTDLAAGSLGECEVALRFAAEPDDLGVWGDVNCDSTLDIIDALAIAQWVVGVRTGVDGCPDDPATQMHTGRGDINNDGTIDVIDALEAARCTVGLAGARCQALPAWRFVEEHAVAWPREIVHSPDGAIHVNTSAHVVRIAADGTRSTYGSFTFGNGLDLGASGEFWATDSRGTNSVHVFDAAGTELRSFGSQGSGPGEFECPNSIDVDGGEVFVFEGDNDRIQVFDEQGAYLRGWGSTGSASGQFNVDCGTASLVVFGDEVYATDCRNERVQVFHRDGTFLRAWSVAGGNHPWSSQCPSGIAIDRVGRLYVADQYHWIRAYSRTGELLETVWSAYHDWQIDGIGGAAGFSEPARFDDLYGIQVNDVGTRLWASHNATPQRVLIFDRTAAAVGG